MITPSNFPFELRSMEQVLVATFTDRRNAKECRRQLEIGCVHSPLCSTKGRVVETEKGSESMNSKQPNNQSSQHVTKNIA